ncbi:hypothetical protein [Metabacillus niabensis]
MKYKKPLPDKVKAQINNKRPSPDKVKVLLTTSLLPTKPGRKNSEMTTLL